MCLLEQLHTVLTAKTMPNVEKFMIEADCNKRNTFSFLIFDT